MPPRSSSVRSMTAMRTNHLLLDRDDRQLVCPAQRLALGKQVVKRPEDGVVERGFQAALCDWQRPMVLVGRLHDAESPEHREDRVVRVELVDGRVFLVRLDGLATKAVDQPHPRRSPVKVADHRAAAGFEYAPHLGDGAGRVARRVQHAIRPDRIERFVRKWQLERVADADFLGFQPCDLEVLTRDTDRGFREIDRRHPCASLQELDRVEAHAAADLEQLLAGERARLALDAFHDPGELVRVHPGADVIKESARAWHQRMVANVLQAERVPVPVIADRANLAFDVFFHEVSIVAPGSPGRIPITLAGTPATTEPSPKLRVTTAPAPTTQLPPRRTPSIITAPAPIQQPGPISTPTRGALRSTSGASTGPSVEYRPPPR